MVDINLIGDDKESDDEERVDDFAHTSSMDTQELTFDERTETFDTTKTAGYRLKRRYSSFVSTLILFGVIIILGGAVYLFLFKEDKKTSEVDLQSFTRDTQEFVESVPTETSEPPKKASITEEEPEPELKHEVETLPSSLPTIDQNLDLVTNRILSTSRSAIQAVTELMTTIPSNLNTTLISYTGQRMRVELVASTASESQNFTNLLTQSFGTGHFTVLSESQVASNGQSLKKVLLSGTIASNGRATSVGRVEYLNLEQTKNWIQNTSQQYGLQIRQIQSNQGNFVDGYLKIPLLIRIFGSKSSMVGFLEEIASQSLNVELTKILLVSPDMITFSDETMILVLNLYLYQPS
ncbi:MAG: hypothetical protein ACE5JB_05640 [bacterium]